MSWHTAFPGINALIPCVGAALVLWSGTGAETPVKRLLSLRPVVFLGLISYSLYLWHWPILSFARYYAVRELTVAERLALLALSLVLAALSWRYIERPFRGRSGLLARRGLFGTAGAATACAAGFGLLAVAAFGWPARIDAETARLTASANDHNPRRDECSFLEAEALRSGSACRLGDVAGTRDPSFIVWGDSHADALMTAFDRLATEHGVTGIYLGRVGCPPLLGVDRPDTDFHCRAFNEAAREVIARSHARRIVLVARWAHYTGEPTYGQEARNRVVISDADAESADVRHNDAVLVNGLRRTLRSLGGRDVFLVSAVPEVGYDVPEVLGRIRHLGRTLDIRPTRHDYEQRQRAIQAVLDVEQMRFGFTQLRPARTLCDTDHCRVASSDRILYFDSHHLSTQGASFVAGELEPVFRPLSQASSRRSGANPAGTIK